jgi:cytochrome c oxidase assembly factor CtaG
VSWSTIGTAWTFPVPVLLLLLACLVRLHLAGRKSCPQRARADGCTLAAMGLVLVAFMSPLDRASDVLLSAHMVQHMLLIFGVAPLLAVGRPWRTWRHALPRSWNVSVTRAIRAVRGGSPRLRTASLAAAAAVCTLWFWHIPAVYDAAVEHQAVHALEHLSFVVSWTALWSSVRHEVKRGRTPLALGMLAVASMAGNALGMLLLFTGPWYLRVHAQTRMLGLSSVQDQQLAGIEMWVLPGFALTGVMARLFLAWLRDLPSHEQAQELTPTSRSASRA